MDGEGVNDHVTLASLIAFHRIDRDLQQFGNMQPVDFFPDHGNLVTVGHDDAYGTVRIEMSGREPVNVFQQSGHDAGFFRIAFSETI